jgi:hypothetical protein
MDESAAGFQMLGYIKEQRKQLHPRDYFFFFAPSSPYL